MAGKAKIAKTTIEGRSWIPVNSCLARKLQPGFLMEKISWKVLID
jgi:hypothetical protein